MKEITETSSQSLAPQLRLSITQRHQLLEERTQYLCNDGGDVAPNAVVRLESDFFGLWLTEQIMCSSCDL